MLELVDRTNLSFVDNSRRGSSPLSDKAYNTCINHLNKVNKIKWDNIKPLCLTVILLNPNKILFFKQGKGLNIKNIF